jgi:hypothetical protein
MMLVNYIGYRSGVLHKEICYCESSGKRIVSASHFLNRSSARSSRRRGSYPRRRDVLFWSYTQRAEDRE